MFRSSFSPPFQNPFSTEGVADAWVTPTDVTADDAASLKSLYDILNGDNWTDNTNWGLSNTANDWFAVTVVAGRVSQIVLNGNNIVGNYGSWIMPTAITRVTLENGADVGGDISGWIIPSSLGILQIALGYASGDISGWVIPALGRFFYINGTSIAGAPDFSTAEKVVSLRFYDTGMSQANIDNIFMGIYNRRASFTTATPVLNIGGTNPPPSGIYQDSTPPTTGNEYKYKLVNDPDGEGFSQWNVFSS